MATQRYTENDITFDIEENSFTASPKLQCTESFFEDGDISPLINAVEIDWNDASLNLPTNLGCPEKIKSTAELLSIIKNLGMKIYDLTSRIETLETTDNQIITIETTPSYSNNIGYNDYIEITFKTNQDATCLITTAQSEFYDNYYNYITNSGYYRSNFGYGWTAKVTSGTGKTHKIKIFNTLDINLYSSNQTNSTKKYYVTYNDIKIVLLSANKKYRSLTTVQNILNLTNPNNTNVAIQLYADYGYFIGTESGFNNIITKPNQYSLSVNSNMKTANAIITRSTGTTTGTAHSLASKSSVTSGTYILYPLYVSNLGLYKSNYYGDNSIGYHLQSLVLNTDYEEVGLYSIKGVTYRGCKIISNNTFTLYIA